MTIDQSLSQARAVRAVRSMRNVSHLLMVFGVASVSAMAAEIRASSRHGTRLMVVNHAGAVVDPSKSPVRMCEVDSFFLGCRPAGSSQGVGGVTVSLPTFAVREDAKEALCAAMRRVDEEGDYLAGHVVPMTFSVPVAA